MQETMPPEIIGLISLTSLIFVVYALKRAYALYDAAFPTWTIHDYQRAVRYERGKRVGLVEPGQQRFRTSTNDIAVYDMREQMVTIPGQEVLSSDSLSFKLSLIANYKVVDPLKAESVTSSYHTALYADIQSALRAVVEVMTSDEILASRGSIGTKVEAIAREAAARYGLEVVSISVRDCMLPGNLKAIYTKVAEAKQEGLAALERARGESAAIRNLANAARTMDNNPNLGYLRLLQTIEKNGGSSMFVLPPALGELVKTAPVAKPAAPADGETG